MKTKLLILFLFSFIGIKAIAQETVVKADESKRIGYTHPSQILTGNFIGVRNTPSVDLKWRPILSRKIDEFEPQSEDKELIEKIKAEKSIQKKKIEDTLHFSSEPMTRSVTPLVGTNYLGNVNSGSSPMDNSIAISNGGMIVSVSNTTIECDNSSGTLLYYNDLVTFINDASITGVCDPVVIYDSGADRFIFFCQTTVGPSKLLVYFSVTNNPSVGGWYGYWFTGNPLNNGDDFDYPKLGLTTNELFISGNLFNSGSFDQSVVYQIDKAACFTGASSPNWQYWYNIANSPFTLLPVSYGQSGNVGPIMTLVATHSGGGSEILLYQITDEINNSPVINYWTVPTTAYSPASDAHQLGTSSDLDNGDCRALSGFYLNGIVHFVFHSDGGSNYNVINYNRLTLNPLSIQSDTYGLTGYDYSYPSVVSFATTATDKSVMIGFGRSASNIYPEVRVVNCDNNMNWSGSTLVKASSSYVCYSSGCINNGVERWGDYTGTSRKHNSTNPSIWMNGMFGNSSNLWDTWIAEIHSSVPIAPVANFTGNPTSGTTPLVVNFSDISTNSPTGWSWTFTGGIPSTSTLQNPTVSYNNVGNYNVKLVASNTGGSDTEQKNNYIHVNANTGIETVTESNSTKIFPNPIEETFFINFNLSENMTLNICIIDINGKIVKELYNGTGLEGENNFSFNKSNLAAGTYFLLIKNEKTILKNEKIIIAN